MEIPKSPRVAVATLAAVFADLTNSYKFYWLLAILDSLEENGQAKMSMQDLCLRMLASVWYPLDFFKLSFGTQDSFKTVATTVSTLVNVDSRPSAPNLYSQLLSQLSATDLKTVNAQLGRLKDWVPYRFIRPFFSAETRGMPDQRVNAFITHLSQESTHAPYRLENQHIMLNDAWREYFQEHQAFLRGFTKWHLVRFLQKHNPNVIGLSLKLEKPGPDQRKLNPAKHFWLHYLEHVPATNVSIQERKFHYKR